MSRFTNPPAGWLPKIAEAGIEARELSRGHWRCTMGPRTVDYWASTRRWRDLGLGIQGDGVASMLKHFEARK